MTLSGRLLVIGHDHVAGLGHLGGALWGRGLALEQITVVPEAAAGRPDVDFRYPGLGGWDGVVTLGAPWPRERIARWWPREVEFLRAALDAGLPVLGICFGGQLLAEALGGGTEPLERPRIGWSEVDGVGVGGAAYGGPWFQWHGEQIVAPPGATVLATSSDGCEAFASGSALGLQFHPEMSHALLRSWLGAPTATLGKERGERLLADTAAQEREGLHERVGRLSDAIVDELWGEAGLRLASSRGPADG